MKRGGGGRWSIKAGLAKDLFQFFSEPFPAGELMAGGGRIPVFKSFDSVKVCRNFEQRRIERPFLKLRHFGSPGGRNGSLVTVGIGDLAGHGGCHFKREARIYPGAMDIHTIDFILAPTVAKRHQGCHHDAASVGLLGPPPLRHYGFVDVPAVSFALSATLPTSRLADALFVSNDITRRFPKLPFPFPFFPRVASYPKNPLR